MSTKKKLVVSICSLCMVLILSVITLVVVFAAENQKLQSQINVTYKATNVAVTISGDYLRKNDPSYTSMGAPIEFLPTDETGTKSIGLNGLELNETETYAIFRYTFQNNSSSVKINVESHSTITSANNITVTYAMNSIEVTNFDNIIGTSIGNFVIPPSGTVYVYVKIKITDLSSDASFTGGFSFDLSKIE